MWRCAGNSSPKVTRLHGVVGNDWIDKKTGKRLYSTEDARFKYLDEETPEHSGTSPFNIKVTTVGDELIYANSKSKVIAIAGKDRSAIGLAGQHGTAYMMMRRADEAASEFQRDQSELRRGPRIPELGTRLRW